MQNYNLGSLNSWKPIGIGEIHDLELPSIGFRSVAFDVMASGMVSVNFVSGDDYWLVAYGQGEISVKFATDRPGGIVVVGDPSVDVFLRTLVDAPVIPESQEISYTTIEPRPAGPSDDFRRMMHVVKINQQRREAHLLSEVRRLTEAQRAVPVDPVVIDDAPAPADDAPVKKQDTKDG